MNKLDPSQTQQLREIVAYLKQKREEQSLSIEQIASRTFIRLHILQALEAAAVENLPELIYVQGFIRRYGDMLQLDGDRLAKQLTQSSSTVAVKTAAILPQSQPETAKSDSVSTPLFKSSWFYIPIVGVAILGISYFLFRPSATEPVTETPIEETTASVEEKSAAITSDTEAESVSEVQPSPIITETTNTAKPEENPLSQVKPSPSPITTETTVTPEQPLPDTSGLTTEANAPLSVAVALKGASWLKIEVDGKTEYEGILQEGEQKTWTAKETLKIRSGNAGAVTYSINQQPAQSLGELGEVKEITLTP